MPETHPCAVTTRRRGVAAVQVATMMTVLLGFAALTVDVGAMYNARAQLQRSADSAALAAASMLGEYEAGNPLDLARARAAEYVAANRLFGKSLTLDTSADVVFGRANYDAQANSYTFTPTNDQPDAVRVTVKKTSGSVNGPLPLIFAAVLGKSHTDVSAQATAIIVPRDIAIVADLSASHNDDSELGNYKNTTINLHEVWDNIPGGIDDDAGEWAGLGYSVDDPQAAGPGWGYFKIMGYGTDPITSSYDPRNDDGLIELKYRRDWHDPTLTAYLASFQAHGYSNSEINAIMDNRYDRNGYYAYRVAVALGLARWDSGKNNGLWEKLGIDEDDVGNGNDIIGSNEIVWLETIGDLSVNASRDMWIEYIYYYMPSTTVMSRENSNFKYRFGIKTFINYQLEWLSPHSLTPWIADTPHQPMQAVKEASQHMMELIDGLDSDDQVSLEIYGETARHEVDLTMNYSEITDWLNSMQAGHYDGWTNMGGGIERGIEELTGVRARSASRKIMVLLSDGYANVDEDGRTGNYNGGRAYALAAAEDAAELGIRIFAVSVGSNSDTYTMGSIAEVGSGEHFHAEGSIDEYSDQLEEIFKTLGGQRPVELIE